VWGLHPVGASRPGRGTSTDAGTPPATSRFRRSSLEQVLRRSRGCPMCAGQDLWPLVEKRKRREDKQCGAKEGDYLNRIRSWDGSRCGMGCGHGRKKVSTLGPSGLPWEQAYICHGRRNLGPSLPKKKYETPDTNQ
jgi:hypothetical protein